MTQKTSHSGGTMMMYCPVCEQPATHYTFDIKYFINKGYCESCGICFMQDSTEPSSCVLRWEYDSEEGRMYCAVPYLVEKALYR